MDELTGLEPTVLIIQFFLIVMEVDKNINVSKE